MTKLLFNPKLLSLFLCFMLVSGMLHAQQLDWAKSVGGSSIDDSRSIAVDKDQNVYIAGTIYGTTNFNPGSAKDTLSVFGGTDIFLAKYDATGKYLWAINMGGKGYDYGKGVTVDTQGNVYLTGYFFGTAGFNPASKSDTLKSGVGFNDVFIAKYTPDGKYLWAKNMGGSKINYGYGIAVGDDGNVYVTGAFSGTTDFNPGQDTAKLTAMPGNFFGGEFDVFVAKYDSMGKYVWAKSMGTGGSNDYGYGIAVDKQGNVHVTGYFASIADFDPGPGAKSLIAAGINDVFIAKYDAGGNYVWARSLGGKADDNGLGITLDKASNVYVTGYFADTAFIFGPVGSAIDTLIAVSAKNGGFDMFVAKYDSAGSYVWSQSLGGGRDDIGMGIAIGRAGNVYVTGYFTDSAVFTAGGPTLKAVKGSQDAFLTKYDNDGKYIWSGNIGGDGYDYGYGIAVDKQEHVFATGNYSATANLDPGKGTANFTVVGSTDIYLLKLLCSDTSSSQTRIVTCEENYTFNGVLYTASGTYKQVLPNHVGCDSTLVLELTLSKVDQPEININEFTLGVAGMYKTYQWMKNGVIIPDATANTYIVTDNGDYQVIVSNEQGCIDTSKVYAITNASIPGNGRDYWSSQIHVYPNPAQDVVHISAPITVNCSLCSLDGRILNQVAKGQEISLITVAEGIYFIQVYDLDGHLLKVEKVVKKL